MMKEDLLRLVHIFQLEIYGKLRMHRYIFIFIFACYSTIIPIIRLYSCNRVK